MNLEPLLQRLKPVHPEDNQEWAEEIADFRHEFSSRDPELFWYLTSGMDWKALVHFNEKDTSEKYHTPTVDLFVYTDYIAMNEGNFQQESIPYFYTKLDEGEVLLFEDAKTRITLDQAIPLWYFTPEEIADLQKTFKEKKDKDENSFVKRFYNSLNKLFCHFCYAYINIESSYFHNEYFPILLSPLENTFVKEHIFKPHGVKFRYMCSVCDGCMKGLAYRCSAEHYKDFLDVMHQEERYWICDHIQNRIEKTEFKENFKSIKDLWNWGHYGRHKLGKEEVELSRLYRLKSPLSHLKNPSEG